MSKESKSDLIERLIGAYRENTSQEGAFDALAAERLGIGLTDLRCLDLIQGRDGMTAGELASASGLTSGAVTGVLDRLERTGYARRVRSESDRRRVDVEVTDRHYEASGEIWRPLMEDWQATLASKFTAEELATVIRFLETVTRLTGDHADRIARRSD